MKLIDYIIFQNPIPPRVARSKGRIDFSTRTSQIRPATTPIPGYDHVLEMPNLDSTIVTVQPTTTHTTKVGLRIQIPLTTHNIYNQGRLKNTDSITTLVQQTTTHITKVG